MVHTLLVLEAQILPVLVHTLFAQEEEEQPFLGHCLFHWPKRKRSETEKEENETHWHWECMRPQGQRIEVCSRPILHIVVGVEECSRISGTEKQKEKERDRVVVERETKKNLMKAKEEGEESLQVVV